METSKPAEKQPITLGGVTDVRRLEPFGFSEHRNPQMTYDAKVIQLPDGSLQLSAQAQSTRVDIKSKAPVRTIGLDQAQADYLLGGKTDDFPAEE